MVNRAHDYAMRSLAKLMNHYKSDELFDHDVRCAYFEMFCDRHWQEMLLPDRVELCRKNSEPLDMALYEELPAQFADDIGETMERENPLTWW